MTTTRSNTTQHPQPALPQKSRHRHNLHLRKLRPRAMGMALLPRQPARAELHFPDLDDYEEPQVRHQFDEVVGPSGDVRAECGEPAWYGPC